MGHADRPKRAANFVKRSLTGAPALVIALGLLLLTPWYVPALLVGLAGLCGLYEYRALLAGEPGVELPRAPLLALGALLGGGAMLAEIGRQTAVLSAVALGWLLLSLLRNRADHLQVVQQAGLGLLGLLWIVWFLNHWILLLRAIPHGNHWAFFLLLVLVCNDICAYLAGSLIGRHPLLPQVSPAKTVEGALGGIAGSLLGGWFAALWFSDGTLGLPLAHLLLLCLPLALLGQAGDLAESRLKRLAGAESSGRFLPGHGGFLDRMDSLLLAAPFLYYYLTLALP